MGDVQILKGPRSWLDGIPQKEVIEEDQKRELLRQSSARETNGASRDQLSSSNFERKPVAGGGAGGARAPTNGKIRYKNKRYCRQMYSDLTSTKKYALTEGPKRWGGEIMWATRSAPPPPSHFMLATGLERAMLLKLF